MTRLRCYGENSFTFLLFQTLVARNQVAAPFLSNLKQFGTGQTLSEVMELIPTPDSEEPDVWLFPNFGKGKGFGEPDAIVLIGSDCFWFEVETKIDLGRKATAARQSLLQLLRFHYLGDSLSKPSSTRVTNEPHLAYIGPTINNRGEVREAVLRRRGHSVLTEIGKRISKAYKEENDHYVLLASAQMRGSGSPNDKFCKQLDNMLKELASGCHRDVEEWSKLVELEAPRPINRKRFWYSYWEGHLKDKCKRNDEDDDLLTEYVPKSSG